MKQLELSKEDQERLKALFDKQNEVIDNFRKVQVELDQVSTKYKKVLLLMVAKYGGDNQTPEGKQIAWEYIEDMGVLVGVNPMPGQGQGQMPQQMRQ